MCRKQNKDMELVAIFTRQPDTVKSLLNVPVIPVNEAWNWTERWIYSFSAAAQ